MRHDVYEIICSTETPILVAKGKKDEIKVAPFTDVKNGAVVISNAIKNVFSPISGSSLKRASDEIETLSSAEVAELKEVAHCKCGASLLTTAELADSLNKHDLYCVVCGQKIEQEEPSDEEDEDVELDVEESCEESDEPKEEVEESCDEADKEMPEDDGVDEAADEEDEEIEIEEEVEEEPEEASADEGEEPEVDVEDDANSEEVVEDTEIEESCEDKPEADEEKPADDKPVEEDASADEEDDESENDEDVELEVEEDEESDDEAEESCVKYNCLSSVDKVRQLELVKCDKGYRILANDNFVASAIKTLAKPELNVLFDDVKSLTKALSAAVSENGFSKEVCASFGIKPLMVKIYTDEAAKQRLNAIEASVKKSYDEQQKEFIQRFEQSLSIASVGVNKGLYGSNLLTQALIKSLAASGQEDAEEVVNEIMAKYGEGYLKQIIAKATELVGKSDDVRNETASLVKAATFSKTKAVNLAHTAVEVEPKVEAKVETTASVTNRYSNLF